MYREEEGNCVLRGLNEVVEERTSMSTKWVPAAAVKRDPFPSSSSTAHSSELWPLTLPHDASMVRMPCSRSVPHATTLHHKCIEDMLNGKTVVRPAGVQATGPF